MRYLIFLCGLFFVHVAQSQLANDNCTNAGLLCPDSWENVNNFGTTAITCLSCQDDFTLCFTPINTAWFTFATYDTGGAATLTIQNVNFDTDVDNDNNSLNLAIFEAGVPCVSQSYSLVHCVNDFSGNISEALVGLAPNTLYYVVFSGTQNGIGANAPSQASFDVQISGPALQRPVPSLGLSAQPLALCKSGVVVLQADTLNCPDFNGVQWLKNGEPWLMSLGITLSTDDVADGDVITAATSCYEDCPIIVTSGNQTLTVYDFQVNAGSDVTIAAGQSVVLSGSTTEMDYFWSPPTGLTNPNILDPTAAPAQTTTYFLTASNGICEITDEVSVFVIEGLEIPNVFSPNGDGVNDFWEILGTENFTDVYVVIYDRSGQKVFESVNYNPLSFWNGTFRGKLMPTTTYFYTIELDRTSPNKQMLKGSVTLVR
jgi:gliding motility-associated-like protein